MKTGWQIDRKTGLQTRKPNTKTRSIDRLTLCKTRIICNLIIRIATVMKAMVAPTFYNASTEEIPTATIDV